MLSRRRAALVLLALASVAFAGFTEFDSWGLRAGQVKELGAGRRGVLAVKSGGGRSIAERPAPAPRLSFSAPVLRAHAIDLDGAVTELSLPDGADLSDALAVPWGTVDLELTLGGPLQLQMDTAGARQVRALDVSIFTIALEDPDAADEAGEVVLELDVAAVLEAQTDADAIRLLQGSARAVVW